MASVKKHIQESVRALTHRAKPKPIMDTDLLSSGCTILNLACANRIDGAISKGTYNFIVGTSDSGKTWLCHSFLAEAARNPAFKDFRLIYDDVEVGSWFDVRRFFGKALAERIEPPCWWNRKPWRSTTVESLFKNIDLAYKAKKPFIYIVDSQDGLSSEIEQKDEAGYAGGKAKYIGQQIRMMLPKLTEKNSIVLIVGQAHVNIGITARFQPHRFSGGDALAYFAQNRIWTTGSNIKRPVLSKDRNVGTLCRARIDRSRLWGGKTTVNFPIYWSLGIDDLGACVRYLIEEKHWKVEKEEEEKDKRKVVTAKPEDDSVKADPAFHAPEFDFKGKETALIKQLVAENRTQELRELTGQVWHEIVAACSVDRPPRYE